MTTQKSNTEKITVKVGIYKQEQPISFTSTQDAQDINKMLADAIENESILNFEDADGQHIILRGKYIAYAIIGAHASQTVGFAL